MNNMSGCPPLIKHPIVALRNTFMLFFIVFIVSKHENDDKPNTT